MKGRKNIQFNRVSKR